MAVVSLFKIGHRQPPLTRWLPPHGPPQRLLPLAVSAQRSTVSSSPQGPSGRLKTPPGWSSRRLVLASGQPLLSAFRPAQSALWPFAVGLVPAFPSRSLPSLTSLSLSQQTAFPPTTLKPRDSRQRSPSQLLLRAHPPVLRVGDLQSCPPH